MEFRKRSLNGNRVRLVPLAMEHCPELLSEALDPELWLLQPRAITNLEEMRGYVKTALSDCDKNLAIPYVVWDCQTNKIVGSTRFMELAPEHKRVEIGATWLGKTAQRTGINLEMKLLMLKAAFETLQLNKVVFKTDALNKQSREAILKLGAGEEGIFKNHLITDSGRVRDIVYYAILREDWFHVETHLIERMRRSSVQNQTKFTTIKTTFV